MRMETALTPKATCCGPEINGVEEDKS